MRLEICIQPFAHLHICIRKLIIQVEPEDTMSRVKILFFLTFETFLNRNGPILEVLATYNNETT